MVSSFGIASLGISCYCLIKSLQRPIVGYLLMLIMIIAKPYIYDGFPEMYTLLHGPLVLGVVLLGVCLLSGRTTGLSALSIKTFIWFTVFLISCRVTSVFSLAGIGPHRYLDEITNMWLLFFIGICVVRDSSDLRNLLFWVSAAFIFIAAVSYYHYRALGWEMPLPANRQVDRNEFASTLAAVVPLFLYIVITARSMAQRLIGVTGIVLIVICVIPSYSRGAFLSLVMAFAMCSTMIENKKVYFSLLALAVLLGFIRVSSSYIDRISSTTEYKEEASAAGRIATYGAALAMVRSAPVLGVGVGRFNENFWTYCPEQYRQFCNPGKSVHSIYLQVLAETGIVGFTSFSAFLLSALVPLRQMLKRRPQSSDEMLACAFGISCAVLLFSYAFLPGAYNGFIYPLLASFIASVTVIQRDSVVRND